MSPTATTGLLCAGVTAVSGFVILPLLRRAHRWDVPNHRSSHQVPTPRGGGLTILAGTSAAAFLAVASSSWSAATWGVVAAAVALSVVGLVDDVGGLAAPSRLLLQVVVGALGGVVIAGLTGAVVGALVLPAAVNMVNFMDGINGLCGSHAAVWGASSIVAAVIGGVEVLAILGALSLAGGLGFLPWNVPRARMFLGDVGSYFLGALAGFGVISALTGAGAGQVTGTVLGLVCVPYLLFAVDTATTLLRRRRAGEPLFEAHRSHIYQRITNEGRYPHWVVSLAIATASIVASFSFLLGSAIGLACSIVLVALYLRAPRSLIREVAA